MNIKRVESLEDDGNEFAITQDGEVKFIAVRETLEDGTRGHWLMQVPSTMGALTVDRDQYSNDLFERAKMHLTGKRDVYSSRFWKFCSEGEYATNVHDWYRQLGIEFGGSFSAEFDTFYNRVIFERN